MALLQEFRGNRLLDALPAPDREQLLADAERVELRFGRVMETPGDAVQHVHFPTTGFISLLVQVDDAPSLEVGMVGREGMLGVPRLLGQPKAQFSAVVQGTGMAWRLETRTLQRELKRCKTLRPLLDGYASSLLMQIARSAGCLHEHPIEQRLARWMLMSMDRSEGTALHVTQAFMAGMLGVRRVGVTHAAAAMQRRGLITYHRGQLSVVDRVGLEASACSCYRAERPVFIDIDGASTAPPAELAP